MRLGICIEGQRPDAGVIRAEPDLRRETLWIAFDRPQEKRFGPPITLFADVVERIPALIDQGIHIGIVRTPRAFDGKDFELQFAGEPSHELVLHSVTVRAFSLDPRAPDWEARCWVNQLDVHAQYVALDAQAAVEHVAYVKVGTDRRYIDCLPFEGERCLSRDHAHELHARQKIGQIVCYHFGKKVGRASRLAKSPQWKNKDRN